MIFIIFILGTIFGAIIISLIVNSGNKAHEREAYNLGWEDGYDAAEKLYSKLP